MNIIQLQEHRHERQSLTVDVKHELDHVTFNRIGGVEHKRYSPLGETLGPIHREQHSSESVRISRKVRRESRGDGGGPRHPV